MERESIQNERQKYLIVKRNDLIQTTAFGLTNAEYDMLNYIIMKIKPEDKDFYAQEISIQDYCRVMGISEKNNYTFIKDTAKGLSDKSIWAFIETEEGEKELKVVRWIEDPVIMRGKIIVKLKPYWKPFLLDIENNYTSLVIQETAPMKSVYGKRTYEILKSHIMGRKGQVIVRIGIEEYKRLIFGNEDYKKKYKEFNNFKIRVLEPAMNDMREYGDLNVSYRLIKEGYTYKYIEFIVEERSFDQKIETWKKENSSLT